MTEQANATDRVLVADDDQSIRQLLGTIIKRERLAVDLAADGLEAVLRPVRKEQELLPKTTRVAYWEGAEAGTGTWQGQPIELHGMGEFVAGARSP